jgi:hypothetical protein
MDYEAIRAARLRLPFRPFLVRAKDGSVFFISEDVHVAVSPKVVALYDAKQDRRAILSPSDVDEITYADQAGIPTPDEH